MEMINRMKKQYVKPQTQIMRVESFGMMIPGSGPEDPHAMPKEHFVPGPGASYAPPANII